jgi:hypothetical protein
VTNIGIVILGEWCGKRLVMIQWGIQAEWDTGSLGIILGHLTVKTRIELGIRSTISNW